MAIWDEQKYTGTKLTGLVEEILKLNGIWIDGYEYSQKKFRDLYW